MAGDSKPNRYSGGWKDWLCCAANEICYTAPNLEAACSPTAMPSVNVDITVTVPFVTLTSVVKSTKIKTQTLTLSGGAHQSDRTSVVTLTSIATSTVLLSSPFSKPTPTAAPKNNTNIPHSAADKQTGMSVTEQAAIGASVSGAAVIAIAAAIFFYRRRQRRRRDQDPQDGDAGSEYHPRNFARIPDNRDNKRSQIMSLEDIAPSLLPPQSVIRSGSDNPYLYDPDASAPPYAPRSPPPAQYRPTVANGQHRYGGPPRRSNDVPPRRPVRGMQARVDDGTEY